MIQVRELTKSYGVNPVLKNITLRFEPGEVHGIVGENGAGKTTFFKCLAGLEKYDGTICSDTEPLKDHLGFLQTEPWFFSRITGREYIRLLCHARHKKTGDPDERNVFGLPLSQFASTYSTGMKKKLALMAILMQENQVYILDEPFNGVDIQSNMIITEIIHRLKAMGKTVIISSHIFSTLSETCDEIHLLRNGIFEKNVKKADFTELEKEMRESLIFQKIEKLNLR